jgi:hypothetical protein
VSSVINIRLLEPGAKIGLSDGSSAEVVTNPMDGVWIFVRFISSPDDPSLEGTEDMVFAADVVELLETP